MAGIIGYADLRDGADEARPALEAHLAAGEGRFRGIRHSTAWDASPDVPNTVRTVPPGTLTSDGFVDSTRLVGRLGLTLDTWIYSPQLPELGQLAQAAPDVCIVLDHLGGPLAIGPYAARREEMLREWRRNLLEVAQRENVILKVGGLGFPFLFPKDDMDRTHDSDVLASFWQTEVDFAIDAFGPNRCMLESNFPVDSYAADYVTLWNTLKKLTTGYSPHERGALFHGTAARVYGLEGFLPDAP
jgi:predicted TIM-barrel fold metal-dependent hydrolase